MNVIDYIILAVIVLILGFSVWFMQTYGDWNYQNQPFVTPVEETAVPVADKKKEQETEEQLTKQAEAVAAAAPA